MSTGVRGPFVGVPDYGPEIVPGARVMNLSGRRGTVVAILDRCHWNCGEWAEQWRPRAAYVEWDGGSRAAGYEPPESLARVPASWAHGVGLVPDARAATGRRLFAPTVVRLVVPDGAALVEPSWWLMNKPERGWKSQGLRYESWAEILRDWAIVRDEPQQDSEGWYVPVRNVASPGTMAEVHAAEAAIRTAMAKRGGADRHLVAKGRT